MDAKEREHIRRLIRMGAATEQLEIETSVRLDEFNSAMRDRMEGWDKRFAGGPSVHADIRRPR